MLQVKYNTKETHDPSNSEKRHVLPISLEIFTSWMEKDKQLELGKIETLERQNIEFRRLLSRYRKETPLGNQPHMIAEEVDALLNS